MTSTRESVLLALDAVLRAALAPRGVAYDRNLVVPTKVGLSGLVILRDGDPGEPERTMSPPVWEWQHRAEIEVFVQKGTGREKAMDDILTWIGAALAADRQLGGQVMWSEPEAPQPSDIPVEAGLDLRAVTVGVALHYITTDPLQ